MKMKLEYIILENVQKILELLAQLMFMVQRKHIRPSLAVSWAQNHELLIQQFHETYVHMGHGTCCWLLK